MFTINDGWGSSDAQDLLASKLFTKPKTINRESKKKRKKTKHITDQTFISDGGQPVDTNANKNTKEKRKKKKRKLEEDNIKDDTNIEDTEANTEASPAKNNNEIINELKSETDTCNDNINQETEESSVSEQTPKKKKKKRKNKKLSNTQDDAGENDTTIQVNDENKDKDIDTKDNTTDIKGNDADELETKEQEITVPVQEVPKQDALSKKISNFQKKMNRKLEGGHFRYINEKLYTKESSVAVDMFKRQPSLFDVYHKGFESQVEHWPQNPVDLIIDYIKEQSSDLIVVDFGCGNAKLGRSVSNKVHSFDLVAVNKDVTVADMKNVPVKTENADIAVFSLSLMGTNVNDFIKESNRILKTGGKLKIAEVKSRFSGVQKFIDGVTSHGFILLNKDESNKMFVMFEFEKESLSSSNETIPIQLKPCIYKRR